MAKKTTGAKAPQTKKTKNVQPAPAAQATVETAVVEEVSAEEMKQKLAEVKIGDIARGNVSGLDANHRVELNGQIIDMFVKNPNARDKWGEQVIDAMTDIAAIGVLTAVADEAVNGNSTFALTIKSTVYSRLVEAGKCLGIELPTIDKLLPGKVAETVSLPSSEVKVAEETANTLVEEKKVTEAGDKGEIELDPEKVAEMGEEALKKALEYLMITGPKSKSLAETFTNTVDFMQNYRIALARKAENSTEAMNKYMDRSMKAVLMDIFSFVKPTFWVKGIGTGLYKAVSAYESPIQAFLILRAALIDKKTHQPVWDDQAIADTVAALVETKATEFIAAEKAALDALDKNAKGYRDVATKHEEQIKKNEAIIASLHDISFDIIDKFGSDDKTVSQLFTNIMKAYYPECAKTEGHYVGLNDNLKQHAGIILNLFRSADNQNSMYSTANLIEVETVELLKAKEDYAKGKIDISVIPFCYRYLFEKKSDEESKKD